MKCVKIEPRPLYGPKRGRATTLVVRAPFNARFVAAARRPEFSGRWDAIERCWEFHPDLQAEVIALVDRAYGTVDAEDPSGDNFASWTSFGADDDGGMYDAFHADVGDRR